MDTLGTSVDAFVDSLTRIYFYYESHTGEVVWPPQSNTGGVEVLDQFDIIEPIADTVVNPQTGLKKKSKAEHKNL